MNDPETTTSADTTEGSEAARNQEPERRLRWWIIGIVVLVTAAAVTLIALVVGNGTTGASEEAVLNTATIRRTDLVVTETLDGTLGYGVADSVTFRSSDDGVTTILGLLGGTVTSIVEEGTVVAAGDVLMEINRTPVVVLYGDLPVYRAFNSRMSDGPDVLQLEQALVDLGYDPDGDITVDEDFTSATGNAIELLQADIGADDDGALNLGEVIFVPEAFYVAETLVDVGSQARSGDAVAALSRPIEGTVTSIVAEGSVVGQGGELLTIDTEPVVLLIGELPVFRTMALGAAGRDVLQLEEALLALGYGIDDSVNGVFDEATREAVLMWQTDIGAQPDGTVNVGDIVFLPNAIRVGENLVAVGDLVRDGTPIMSTSISSTFVTVELSTDDQDLVAVGDAVVVELPDGTKTTATVTEIGTVVQANQQGATYFETTVTLDDPAAAPGLDEAPVDVEIVGESVSNVLAVPVTALLALSEGGYAVEVVDATGGTLLVAVEPGLFADSLVEIDAVGLEAGMAVVVP